MVWYKRTRFVFDALSSFSPKTPNQDSIFLREIHHYSNATKPDKLAAPFLKREPIFLNHFLLKRFYCADKRQVHHFLPRGFKHWLDNHLVTVPFIKRKHFVVWSKTTDWKQFENLREAAYKKKIAKFNWKILPATHPESVRIRVIAEGIIESFQRKLNKEQASGDDTLKALSKEDENLDDNWVEHSRNKGILEGLSWDVVVVGSPTLHALCDATGKIVFLTGIDAQSDAEIAVTIAHEVAHIMARHHVEKITKNIVLLVFHLDVLYNLFVMPHIVITMPIVIGYLVIILSTLFLRRLIARRHEMEADYIGLMLIAIAGYDPWVASKHYFERAKLAKLSVVGEAWENTFSTHPTSKKRAQLLAQPKVMEEALHLYRKTREEKGVEGFLSGQEETASEVPNSKNYE